MARLIFVTARKLWWWKIVFCYAENLHSKASQEVLNTGWNEICWWQVADVGDMLPLDSVHVCIFESQSIIYMLWKT